MLRAAVLALACVSLPACAAECYTADSSHGKVSYELQQAGAPFRGVFGRFGGEICLAAGRATSVEVWLEPASVDSGLPEIDAALRTKDFFDVNQYPRITFTSESVEARGNAQLAHGVLRIKRERRNTDVVFQLRRDSGGIEVSGQLTLNRLDYGIGLGEWSNISWLGAAVKVEFRATLSAK